MLNGRVRLADGQVHRRSERDDRARCGVAIPAATPATIAVTTCASCIVARDVPAPSSASYEADAFIDVDLVCSCGERSTRRIPGDVLLSALGCDACGSVGHQRVASPPPERIEQPEPPPGPEV